MKTQSLHILLWLLTFASLLGCNKQDTPQPPVVQPEKPPAEVVNTPRNRADRLRELKLELERLRGPALEQLSGVDNSEREFGGIRIRGSALTDEHVSSIIKLTSWLADNHPDSKSDTLVHAGHNKCHRIWRHEGGSSAVNLELVDGRWEIDSMVNTIECKFDVE